MAPPKSEVWRHFTKDGKVAQCKHCLQVVASSANTTNMWSHLKNKHNISRSVNGNDNGKRRDDGVDAGSRQASAASGARAPRASSNSDVDDPPPATIDSQAKVVDDISGPSCSASASVVRKRGNSEDRDISAKHFKLQTLESTFAKAGSFSETGHKTAELNNALIYMVCKDNLPLSTAEHAGFRRFAKVAVPLYKPPSRKTLTRMVDAKYEGYKEIMKRHFATLKSVTLTSDIWTEDQTKQSYLGITVHYLPDSASNEICTANIGIVPLSESHTSAYIAEKIRETLCDWNISVDTVSLIVTDNGANMVAAAKEVFGSSRHIGCYGHTLNLIVTQALAACPALEKVIHKIKSIVTFFKSSVAASDSLKKLQIADGKTEGTVLKLVQDVETRWNSTYQMLDRFVMLADIISTVLLKQGNTGRDMITGSELSTIAEAIRLLKPMFLATEELSAEKYTTTSKVIPICRLMRQSISVIETSDSSVGELKRNLLAGIDKRFANVERVHVFAISTLLDPRFKRLHFGSALTQSETIQHVSNMMKAAMRESESEARASLQEKETPLIDPDDLWGIHDSMVAATPSVPALDAPGGIPVELRQFLNTPVVPRSTNPIAEWRALKSTFPYLAEIALKYLSMVATSVPSERLFSKAGNTVTKQRNRLLGKRISKLLFLGSLSDEMWFK